MRNLTINVDIFSPRWGHNDEYTIRLEPETLKITASNAKSTSCSYVVDHDPVWEKGSETLISIFRNDQIVAPENILSHVESIWEKWRDQIFTDEQTEEAFKSLITWINNITNSKPDIDIF